MRILLIILITFTSCQNKHESKSNKIPYEPNKNSTENLATKNDQKEKFQRIPYSLQYDYLDILGTKIKPNENYEYWQYAKYEQGITGDVKYSILKQGGDTLQRKKINEKINPIEVLGIFKRGHPNYCCNYAIYIKNKKINYIKTEEEFRTFIGEIDNLEEAVILARTYGYLVGSETKAREYRKVENGYELHLMKYYDYPPSKELIEINIKKDGFIKTKSLGIYKTGKEVNE